MKLFYDDAIEAQYMAQTFGVKYACDLLKDCYAVPHDQMKLIVGNELFDAVRIGDKDDKFYIHPESLPIFEPQDGDVVEHEGIDFGIVLGINDCDVAIQFSTDDKGSCIVGEAFSKDLTIIQRNGKPFITPKHETI